jgi:hypothetical protein
MRAQKLWRSSAGLVPVGLEAFPERDCRLRIVTSARHVDQPAMVGLGFLGATVRQQHRGLGAEPIEFTNNARPPGIFRIDIRAETLPEEVLRHSLAHTFASVLKRGVGDLVPEHRRQSGVVLRERQDARVHAYLAAGQTKCVGLLAFKDDEFPLRIWKVDHGADALPDAPYHRIGRGVVADGLLLLHLIEAADPELSHLAFGHDQKLLASGLRIGDATSEPN